MLNKLICWLRKHEWRCVIGTKIIRGDFQICKRCGWERIIK